MKKYLNQSLIDAIVLVLFTIVMFFSESILRWSFVTKTGFQAFEFALIPSFLFLLKRGDFKKYIFFFVSFIIFFLFNHAILKDLYFNIHPFYSYHVKILIGFFFYYVLTWNDDRLEENIIKTFLSSAIFFLIYFLYKFMFQHGDFNYWDRLNSIIYILCLCLSFRLVDLKEFKIVQKMKAEKNKFIILLMSIIFFGVWSVFVFKQEGSYQKFNFFLMALLFTACLPKYFKFFMIALLSVLCLQTAMQLPLINYDVSYSFMLASGVASIIFIAGQILGKTIHGNLQVLSSSFAILILGMTFIGPFHLYQIEQKAMRQNLIQIATRMKIYQKAKIIPAKNEVSEEAKKAFGKVLSHLVRFHPVGSYEDIFGVNISQIFSHARPMYSDETYDKHMSRLRALMNQLNLDWNIKSEGRQNYKQFILTSIDFNDRITKINDDDYVSNDLNLTLPLKSGKQVRSKLDTRGAMIYLTINEVSVLNFSLNEIVFNHVPGEFNESIFKADLQPDIMDKEIESNGLRIRVKLNRIVGRKNNNSFDIHQVQGQIFIKELE